DLDRSHIDQLGRSRDAHWVSNKHRPTVLSAFHAWSGGGRFLSGNCFVSDLLVSPAGTGPSNCAAHGGLALHWCSWCVGFRAHFGPPSLARGQPLALAANTRRDPGLGLRRAYLFPATNSSRRV